MALETYTVEVRVDHDDPALNTIAEKIIRMHAKAIQASLMLLQSKRPPMISFMGSNMFEREREISLADDMEVIDPTTLEAQGDDTNGQV
jgi:hypothetical protein